MAWLILGVLTFGVAFVFSQFFAEGYIKDFVEKDLAQKTNLQLKVGSAKVRLLPPIAISMGQVEAAAPDQTKKMIAEQAEVRVDLFSLLTHLPRHHIKTQILLLKPVIQIRLPPAPTANASATTAVPPTVTSTSISFPENFDANVVFDLQGGEFHVTQQGVNPTIPDTKLLSLNQLYITLEMPNLRSPWNLKVLAEQNTFTPFLITLPLDFYSEIHPNFETMKLDFKNAGLRFVGISTQIAGQVNLNNMHHSWDAKFSAPDLASIKNLSLPGIWRGSILANIKVNAAENLAVSGAVNVKDVMGDFSLKKEGFSYEGILKSTASTSFVYQKQLDLKTAVGFLDLTEASLTYKNLFKKERNVAFNADFDLGNDQNGIQVKKLKARLAQLQASGSGLLALSPEQSSEIDIHIPKTNMAGLEKNFPLLQAPLVGSVQIDASIKGDFQKPDTLLVNVNPIVLENLKVNAKWSSEDKTKTINGLSVINAKATVILQGHDLKSSQVDAQADLTHASLLVQDMFVKALGQPFRLSLVTSQSAKTVNISKATFYSSAGPIDIKGTVSDPLNPLMNLNIETAGLNLTNLAQIFPMLKKWKLSGVTQARLNLSGQYLFKEGITLSPLALNGRVSANLPEFNYQSPPAPVGATGSEPAPAPAPESIFPQWPILKTLKLQTDLKVGKLTYNDLLISGLTWQGKIDKGQLNAKFDIKNLFDATVSVIKLRTSLTNIAPTTLVDVIWGNMDLARATDWFFPNWKGLVSGVSSGAMDISLLHPTHKKFLNDTVIRGSMKVSQGFLSTLKFDEIINKKLHEFPGVGDQTKINSKGVAGNISTSFEFTKSMLNLKPFNVVTPEKNELQAQAWIKTDKSMELRGDVYLSNPPVKGSILEANSDESGRMVVPVRFTGTVTNPELNIAEQTIKTMLTKTAQYETRKAANLLRKKAESEFNQQVDQGKKKLQEEVSKGFKNIFK
ncbi:MAG: hypothetical protein AB7F59_04440 [Bdellovibrionales bacterium]